MNVVFYAYVKLFADWWPITKLVLDFINGLPHVYTEP